MKNILYLSLAISLLLINDSLATHNKGFRSYENTDYNYKIILPRMWKDKVQTKKSVHTLQVIKDNNTSIKIEAYSTKENIDNIIRKKKWDLRSVNSRFRKIIETDKISINKDTVGKLLVYEYIAKRSNFLHRTIVAKNNDMIYIIDCKSPTWYFYTVENIFTTALASFSPLSKMKSAGPEKPEEETIKFEDDKGIEGIEELDSEDEDLEDMDLEEEL